MNPLQTNTPARPERDVPTIQPLVDVAEDASGLTLLVDMPGVPKDAIELHLEGNALSISGDIAATAIDGLAPIYSELNIGRYRRAFTLSRELDTTRIEATGKDGVLRLRIPKLQRAQPRRIEVHGV